MWGWRKEERRAGTEEGRAWDGGRKENEGAGVGKKDGGDNTMFAPFLWA